MIVVLKILILDWDNKNPILRFRKLNINASFINNDLLLFKKIIFVFINTFMPNFNLYFNLIINLCLFTEKMINWTYKYFANCFIYYLKDKNAQNTDIKDIN